MTVQAVTVNKVCLSGLESIHLADLLIGSGGADVVGAGGTGAAVLYGGGGLGDAVIMRTVH